MRPLSSSRGRAAPFFVVSPHLDDAVFSCGMLLASHPGSIVCTVLCGAPDPPQRTAWDRAAGHRDSTMAIQARIAEDERALAIVGARGLRLPFPDSQYGAIPTVMDVARGLTHAWLGCGAERLVIPLGLYHSDHVLVSDACRLLARRERLSTIITYEDALYRAIGGIASDRYQALSAEGCTWMKIDDRLAASLRRAGAANAKWRAVRAYRSQLRAFADPYPHDLAEPERYARAIMDPARSPPR